MINDKEGNEMTVGVVNMRIFDHGIDALMEKIEEQAYWMFDDAEEIGSSDISACVRAVLSDYYPGELVQASVQETALVRNYVHNCIRMNSERKAA
jgi:hypothetical protein